MMDCYINDEGLNQLKFLYEIGNLKHLKRAGWVIQGRDIENPETVSGHMYRMGIIGMMLTEDYPDDKGNLVGFDRGKVVQMALVHDMAECIVGDITPFDGIKEEEKHRLEREAMDYLTGLLKPNGNNFTELYEEYEARVTIESKIVKELDRFDVMVQGFEYEKKEWEEKKKPAKFQEFFDNAIGNIKHPQLVRMMEALDQQRTTYWMQVNKELEEIKDIKDMDHHVQLKKPKLDEMQCALSNGEIKTN